MQFTHTHTHHYCLVEYYNIIHYGFAAREYSHVHRAVVYIYNTLDGGCDDGDTLYPSSFSHILIATAAIPID